MEDGLSIESLLWKSPAEKISCPEYEILGFINCILEIQILIIF